MTLQFTAYVCHFSDVIHSTHSTLHPSQIPSKDTAGSNPTSSRQNSSQIQQTHFDDRGCCYRGPLHDRWFLCLQERGDQGCHVLHHRRLFSFVRRISDLQAPHELNRFIFSFPLHEILHHIRPFQVVADLPVVVAHSDA